MNSSSSGARRATALALLALWSSFSIAACRRRSEGTATAQTTPTAVSSVVVPVASASASVAPAIAASAAPSTLASAPAGALAGAASTNSTAGALAITHGKVTLFRWSDGNWHARYTVRVQNNGPAPVDVDRAHFVSPEWNQTATLATFPDHTSVIPGMAVEGDITFWVGGDQAQPTAVTLQYVPGGEGTPPVFQQSYAPAFSPVPPAPGQAPTRVLYSLPVTVPTVTTWEIDEHERHVTVTATVTNALDVAVRIPRDFFKAFLGETELSAVGPGTTMPDPIELAPGASATNALTFHVGANTPAPATLRVVYGPNHNPQFDRQVPVTAGTAPAQ